MPTIIYKSNNFYCLQDSKKFLHELLNSVEGLYSIIITDRDGVPVLSVANEVAPELAMRTNFLSTFTMATEQGSKLGLGKNKSVICMYSSYQVITQWTHDIRNVYITFRIIPMSNVQETFQKRSKNVFRTLDIGMFLERL